MRAKVKFVRLNHEIDMRFREGIDVADLYPRKDAPSHVLALYNLIPIPYC